MTFPSNFTPSDEEEAFAALEREAHMSDDALAKLLQEFNQSVVFPYGVGYERAAAWFRARGVVVLPPAIPQLLSDILVSLEARSVSEKHGADYSQCRWCEGRGEDEKPATIEHLPACFVGRARAALALTQRNT